MIAYHVYKISGLPKSHIIGTGTSVDSARLKNFIGDLLNVDPHSVQAYSMGEHGDVDLDKLALETARAGWKYIIEKKQHIIG